MPYPDWTWNVYGIRSDSSVAAIGTVAVIGNGKIFGGRLVREFGAAANSVNSLTLAVDYKDFGQNVVLPGDVSAATPIHYLVWSGQLATTRVHETYEWQNSLGLYFGWDGLVGNDAEFEYKRSGASASYAYLRGSTRFTWRTWHGFAIMTRLGLQYSEAPLVNNEQFSLGGMDTVRGYLEAEALVDSALAATVELQFPKLTLGPAEAVGYLFYDRGVGMNQQPLESEVLSGSVRTDLASFGVGFRGSPMRGMNASLEFADPRLPGTRTIRGDERVLFSVQYGF
jgi:hemolysin activation/secretion protein